MKNQFRRFMFGAALAVFAWAPGYAHADTLQDAVSQAVQTHPSILAAREAEGASSEAVREQKSAYFPEISANVTGGRIYSDTSTTRGLSVLRGTGYSYMGEGSATLSQRVMDWGETGNKVDAAKAREVAANSQVAGTEEAVALRATQAFVSLLRASELKDKAAHNLENIKGYREKIAVQVQEGGSDEAEINRADDFLLLAKNAATDFEGQYQAALANYVEAFGHPPVSPLERPMLPSTFPKSIDAAVEQADQTHPQVIAAQQSLIASDHDVRAETTSYLPKVKGELSYLKRDQKDLVGGETVDARALMKMDWNYSVGGAQHARVDRASHVRAQAKAQLQEVYRRIERDIRVAWSALDVVREQFKTQEERKEKTAKVVETYKEQYEGDKRTLIEIMQAESQAFDAQVAFANADYGILNATYTLMGAMGQLLSSLAPGDTPSSEIVSTSTETTDNGH